MTLIITGAAVLVGSALSYVLFQDNSDYKTLSDKYSN